MNLVVLIEYKDFVFYLCPSKRSEPIHIYVASKRPASKSAKFWVGHEGVTLADSGSFDKNELRDIETLLDIHLDVIIAQWSHTFGTVNFYEGLKQGDLQSMDLDCLTQ